MRALLYDLLTTDTDLQQELGGADAIKARVMPRRSQGNINIEKPFIIFGLGNATNEQLSDSTSDDEEAYRQFFQIWVHDEGESFVRIDDLIQIIKRRLIGVTSPAHHVVTIFWLETSQEFNNETYNTNFRYIRFQAVIAQGGTSA